MVGRLNQLWLKRECNQTTGSFKERGAYTKVHQLHEAGVLAGVVAASAGNHAQGVARAAHMFGVPAEIHIPFDTPLMKINGIQRHGGNDISIICHPDFTSAKLGAEHVALRHEGVANIVPYDDEYVIAGQGTVGLEILEQAEAAGVSVDKIFVPVGGGGLLAGVAEAAKRVNPAVQVIGVQLEGNDSAFNSFHAGRLMPSSGVTKLCDGTAVEEMGELCFEKMMQYVDDVVLVTKAELGEAYAAELGRLDGLANIYGSAVYDDLREPAGMLAEAAAVAYGREHEECANENWVGVASGGNYDLARIDAFIEAYELSRVNTAQSRLGHAALLNGSTVRAYVPSPLRHKQDKLDLFQRRC